MTATTLSWKTDSYSLSLRKNTNHCLLTIVALKAHLFCTEVTSAHSSRAEPPHVSVCDSCSPLRQRVCTAEPLGCMALWVHKHPRLNSVFRDLMSAAWGRTCDGLLGWREIAWYFLKLHYIAAAGIDNNLDLELSSCIQVVLNGHYNVWCCSSSVFLLFKMVYSFALDFGLWYVSFSCRTRENPFLLVLRQHQWIFSHLVKISK